MIARIVLVVSLVLLAAAPGSALAGTAPSADLQLLEQVAPTADDDAAVPVPAALAVAPACAGVCPAPSGELALPRPALARIFRPPRPAISSETVLSTVSEESVRSAQRT